METLIEMLRSRFEHLVGRAGGPLNFRLFIMPLVVTFFAVRAAMRDARAGQPRFFMALLTKPLERGPLVRSMLKDIGKIFIMAILLDTTYQLLVLKAFYLGELLLVVMVSALLPYLVVRSAVSPLMRRIYRKHPKATSPSAAHPKETSGEPPPTTDH
jgi:hypothetical protein